MNFISYNGAYSLFPKATFGERRGLTFRSPCDPSKSLEKYMSRGWDLQDTITEKEQSNLASTFRVENRWVGDKKCWIFPFKDVSPESEAALDPFTLNSFSLMFARVNRPEPMIDVQFAFLRHSHFNDCYTASFCLTRKLNYFFKALVAEEVQLNPEES